MKSFWDGSGFWRESLEEEVVVVCHTGVVEGSSVIRVPCESEEDFFGIFVFMGCSYEGIVSCALQTNASLPIEPDSSAACLIPQALTYQL